MGSLLLPPAGQSAEEDVDGLVMLLEVVVVAVLLLALFVVRVRWLRRILECVPELVALLGGVVAVWMPREPLLQQVLEATGVLLRVLLRRALDSRDSVVWLALAVGTRVVVVVVVVVVATTLVRVVAAAAALVLLALATYGVVLGIGLVFSSTQDVIMSLRWGMDQGWRRPKSSKVRRW
jgi:hypothetical protein